LTHATLAAMVGVGRPFLTMTLSQLEQRDLMRSVRRRIVIRDPSGLKALAFEESTSKRRKAANGVRGSSARRAAASIP